MPSTYILMKTKQSDYNCRCICNILTKLSLSKPLLKSSKIRMTILSLFILPYEIIILMPSMSPPFTMRRPPYIGLERPNHLRDTWDRLKILLLQLWIFPKIKPWPQIWIQPTSEIKGILPWFLSTVQNSLKQANAPSKWGTECCNTPPKQGRDIGTP